MSDVDVDAVTALLNDQSLPLEVRAEIANSWVMADPEGYETWGPVIDANCIVLTEESRALREHAERGFGGFGSVQPGFRPENVEAARESLDAQVSAAQTTAGAAQRAEALRTSGGADTSDDLLNQAQEGLRYFEVFLPLYGRVAPTGEMSRDAACARFDESRDMSFAVLRADATLLSEAAADLEPEHRCIINEQQDLGVIWQGATATAATGYLGTFAAQADQVRVWLTNAASALSGGADSLEAAIRDKALVVAELYDGTAGGRTPEQIDTIITVSQGYAGSSDNDDTIRAMAQWFEMGLDEDCWDNDLTEETRHHAIRACIEFLDFTFKPEVESTWTLFISQCETCDEAVVGTYEVIAASLAEVDPAVFTPLAGGVPADPAGPPPRDRDGGADSSSDGDGGGGSSSDGDDGGGSSSTDDGGGPGGGASSPPPGGLTGISPGGGTPPPPPAPAPDLGISRPQEDAEIVPGPGGAPGGPGASGDPVLPGDSVWVGDATELPDGWTVDPATGEASPPGAPGAGDDVGIHTPAGQELFDDDGQGDLSTAPDALQGRPDRLGVPGELDPADPLTGPGGPADAASAVADPAGGVTGENIRITDDGVTLDISADGAAGGGALVTVTDDAGETSQYRIEVGADGTPQLVPQEVTAGVDAASTTAAAGPVGTVPAEPVASAPPAGEPAPGGGGSGGASAAPYSPPVPDGMTASPMLGSVAAEVAAATDGAAADAPAQVRAAAVEGGDAGAAAGPALASAPAGSDGTGASLAGGSPDGDRGQSGTSQGGGAPMAPMGGAGAGGGGDAAPRSSQWQVDEDTFAVDDSSWASLVDVLGSAGGSDDRNGER